ncbi:hypothetical protein ACFYPT_39295 [Streptomyces sp. NPDC005529]|uniref:hypothetical protein n=1 Tax=unclassified Streptomyces TaxID=2593676 RepID=UPI0033A33D99
MRPLLLRTITHYFQGNIDAAQSYLIDAHPAGWYTIGGDFMSDTSYWHERQGSTANLCYCHGQAPSPALELDDRAASDAGVEWAYVLGSYDLRILTPIQSGWYEISRTGWPYLPLSALHPEPALSASSAGD